MFLTPSALQQRPRPRYTLATHRHQLDGDTTQLQAGREKSNGIGNLNAAQIRGVENLLRQDGSKDATADHSLHGGRWFRWAGVPGPVDEAVTGAMIRSTSACDFELRGEASRPRLFRRLVLGTKRNRTRECDRARAESHLIRKSDDANAAAIEWKIAPVVFGLPHQTLQVLDVAVRCRMATHPPVRSGFNAARLVGCYGSLSPSTCTPRHSPIDPANTVGVKRGELQPSSVGRNGGKCQHILQGGRVWRLPPIISLQASTGASACPFASSICVIASFINRV